MKLRILLFLLWIFLLPGYGFCEEHTLLILHTNDFHGHLSPWVNKALAPPPREIGGSAYMAALIRKYREKNPRALLLDAGDIAQGTMVSNLFKGAPVLAVMNALKYDAGTLGNHEFDWGLPATLGMIKQARFPVLCANVRSRATGKLLPGTRPYVILKEGDIKIGLIGLITPETPQVTHPKNVKGLEFLPPLEVIRRYYPIVKSHGADLVMALSHCGLGEDRQIARGTNLLDAIIGGHSHTELREAVTSSLSCTKD
ncbi:MAG: metallophosphatase [Armatimonadetes bacterium]|nr:metallophosphatase [Armatimonadota bacterium]